MEWASEQARIHIADPLPLRAGVGGTRPRMENDVDRPRVVSAHAGDHALVYALLRSVNQSPAHDDFINWLDEPSYLPVDRLLVKKREQILAHAQVLHRAAWFQGIKLPVAGLRDVVVLPEYERTGCLQMLIHAACEAMHAGGAVISLVRTEQPELLVPYGWSEVRAPGYSRASVGDLLAYLSMHKRRSELAHRSRAATRFAGPFRRRCRPLRVRLWRHVELSALRAVYDESFVNGWGGLCRTDAYWQWLIGRNAHSDLIVAVEGEAPSNDSTADTHIVGYAVTRGSQVLELCCQPGFARAGPRLLARACQEAIERDRHTISLHISASDPLHELMVTAGGTWCQDDGTGGTFLAKLLDPCKWVEAMFPLLRDRARAARMPRPFTICFEVGGDIMRLVVTRRRSRLLFDPHGRAEVRCAWDVFTNLLIGNLDASQIRSTSHLEVSSEEVASKLAALFPPAIFWQSPFDAL